MRNGNSNSKKNLSTIFLVYFSIVTVVKGLNYIKIPNLEDEKIDLELVDNNVEVNFHKNLISSVQSTTKEVVCNTLIRNLLTSIEGQKIFMSKINLSGDDNLDPGALYDDLLSSISKKCVLSIPPKLVLNNLTPMKILNMGSEEEEYIKNLVVNFKIKEIPKQKNKEKVIETVNHYEEDHDIEDDYEEDL